jgi:hypothetical protein
MMSNVSNDEWIEWNGGDCPVKAATVVEYKRRDGVRASPRSAIELDWGHFDLGNDIIAYRLVREV